METSLEDLNEANRTYVEYLKKKNLLFDNIKILNRRALAASVQTNFQKFSIDNSYKKAFDLSRNRQETRISENKVKSAAQLLSQS